MVEQRSQQRARFGIGHAVDPCRPEVALEGLHHELGARIEAAVTDAVAAGQGTQDIGGALGTSETGDWIAARIRQQ